MHQSSIAISDRLIIIQARLKIDQDVQKLSSHLVAKVEWLMLLLVNFIAADFKSGVSCIHDEPWTPKYRNRNSLIKCHFCT